jgi:uncharacterized protein with HEPN domain
MPRDSRQYLQDILDAIAKVEQYVDGLAFDGFKADSLRIDGVNMNLIIIGEAANAIPLETQRQYPEIDWRNIVGLRNAIAHEYFRLNLERIWDIIEVELPLLKQQISLMIAKEDQNDGKE